jgi:uncharacterized protein
MSVKNLFDSPVFAATERGDVAGVRSALVREPLSLKLRYKGETPLHIAARKGFQGVVELLVEYGADLEARNKAGSTALSLACSHGNTSVTKFLLKKGAAPDVADKARCTPLMMAAQNGHSELVKSLLAYPKGVLTLDEVDEDHCTALFMACARGHWNIVKMLVGKGADYQIPDHQGTTPEDLVKHRGDRKGQVAWDG